MINTDLAEKYAYFSKNSIDSEYFMMYIYAMLIKCGDTVIDVGANHALHTVPLSQLVGSNGRVYAFEAIPNLAIEIEKMAINNITVINSAVTNEETTKNNLSISFIYATKNDGYSGLKYRPDMPNWAEPMEIATATTTLDNSIPIDRKISFIKLDVECGELHVLQGATRILRNSRPIIVMEHGRQFAADIYGYSMDDFFTLFDEFSYELFTFTGEKFDRDYWEDPNIFWELWAVPKESPHLAFFEHNLKYLVYFYVKHRKSIMAKKDHEIKKKSEQINNILSSYSWRMTAVFRNLWKYRNFFSK